MKKAISLLLVLVLVCVGFTACGNSGDDSFTGATDGLELNDLELTTRSDSDYMVLSGYIKNITNDTCKELTLKGKLYDSSDNKLDSEFTDLKNIAPGESKHFNILFSKEENYDKVSRMKIHVFSATW